MPAFERIEVPLRIGVVSDTHLVNPRRGLPPGLVEFLRDSDVIFHAGDVNHRWVLDALGEIAPVHAVHGNNDSYDLQRSLPTERYFDIGGHKLGLIHGHVAPGSRYMTARNVAQDRMRGVVDCVVYGHSHRPEVAHRAGLLMINPGSPTQPRWAPAATLAIVNVDDTIDARLIEI